VRRIGLAVALSAPEAQPGTLAAHASDVNQHRMNIALAIAFVLAVVTGRAPSFDRAGKSQAEFDGDDAQCLEANTRKTAARYGPSLHTDWANYAQCMSSRGYRRK